MRFVILKVRNPLLCTVLRGPLYVIACLPGSFDRPTQLNKPWARVSFFFPFVQVEFEDFRPNSKRLLDEFTDFSNCGRQQGPLRQKDRRYDMGVRLSGAFVLWSEKNGKNIIHCHLSTIEEEIEIKMLFALAIIADRGLCCIQRHQKRPLSPALYVLQTYFRIRLAYKKKTKK